MAKYRLLWNQWLSYPFDKVWFISTSAKEVMQSSLFVYMSVFLSISNFAQKPPNAFA